MTRILKCLGLAICMAAIAAVVTPAAQAQTGAVTTPLYPSILTAQQQGGVTFDIGEAPNWAVTCSSNLEATLTAATDPVTFTPTYANCSADPGLTPVTVTLNGCDYTIGVSKPGTTGQPVTTGALQASIDCPVGQQIEIHVYQDAFSHALNISTCTYDIAPQGPVPAGTYHNTSVGIPDVDLTVNARFTARSTIGAGFLPCGGDPITQHLPVTLTGTYTVRAFDDLNGVEGPQIPVDVG
ncbi:MAG TPA: hypothetical protein VHR18_05465 [Solirubrobacterales bacterium]|jgi:hypothetical protein|nr:hypothetical protein [Solirubrobacterales bacterium]